MENFLSVVGYFIITLWEHKNVIRPRSLHRQTTSWVINRDNMTVNKVQKVYNTQCPINNPACVNLDYIIYTSHLHVSTTYDKWLCGFVWHVFCFHYKNNTGTKAVRLASMQFQPLSRHLTPTQAQKCMDVYALTPAFNLISKLGTCVYIP